MTPDRHGGPIDPWSPYDLYDVLAGDVPQGESTEFYGLHVTRRGSGSFLVQPDGYAGELAILETDEYGDVLELVDELNGLLLEWRELQDADLAERVERAGKLVTSDPAKAEDDPELYLLLPSGPEATA